MIWTRDFDSTLESIVPFPLQVIDRSCERAKGYTKVFRSSLMIMTYHRLVVLNSYFFSTTLGTITSAIGAGN